jgi:hypothetical protein
MKKLEQIAWNATRKGQSNARRCKHRP